MDRAEWGSDVKPSLPVPPVHPILVDLDGSGFCFTTGGIAHLVNESDLEHFITPTNTPSGI
jgi:hypothetical protein